MKFANLLKGTRAERPLDVPGYTQEGGKPFAVLLRPLTGIEFEAAYAWAIDRAKAKGAEAREGDPVYDLAVMAAIDAIGCLDPDSPAEARSASFDGGAQVLEHLSPELIVYIHEQHEVWQSECSPSTLHLGGEDMVARVREVAGPGGIAAFMRLSPSMRVLCATFMASQLWPSLEAKFGLGSVSAASSATSEKPLTETSSG